jgi:protocatechuate 3,4-dioxygenase beta subunit
MPRWSAPKTAPPVPESRVRGELSAAGAQEISGLGGAPWRNAEVRSRPSDLSSQQPMPQSVSRLVVVCLVLGPVGLLARCASIADPDLPTVPTAVAADEREPEGRLMAGSRSPAAPAVEASPARTAGVAVAASVVGTAEVLRGRVVDLGGNGVVGVVVGPAAAVHLGSATSGDDGAFTLGRIPAMPNLVAIDARWETVQAARPDRNGPLTIVVAERLALAGLVVDAAGTPVADAMVAVVPAASFVGDGVARQWLTFSAVDGTFAFTSVPALPGARLRTQRPGLIADDRELPLRATIGLVVQLQPEPAVPPVFGTVFGPDGAPLAGATARLGEAAADTSGDGAFRLAPTRAIAPGTPLLVHAHGCMPVQLPDPRPGHGGAPAPQTVLLRPALALRGRIVDAAGVPLRGWNVLLADPTPLRPSGSEASVEGQLGGVRVATDEDGAFCFVNVFDRAYTLEAWANRGGGVLRASVSPAHGQVTLTAAPQPVRALHGIVLDEAGVPVAGVVVGEARPGYGQVHALGMRFDERATTDGAGRFTLARAGCALHLLVDGEAIVPVRVAVAANAGPEALLTVRVRRRCAVQWPGDAQTGIAVSSVDADGMEQPACGDAADRLGVAASATALVVHRHGVAIGRLPLVGMRRDLELCVQSNTAARTGR